MMKTDMDSADMETEYHLVFQLVLLLVDSKMATGVRRVESDRISFLQPQYLSFGSQILQNQDPNLRETSFRKSQK